MNTYQSEAHRQQLARQIVTESAVLLKNSNHCLPLGVEPVSFFGRACYQPNLSGSGSGDAARGREVLPLPEVWNEQGMRRAPSAHRFYTELLAGVSKPDPLAELLTSGVDLVASGIIYELFGRYNAQENEINLPEDIIRTAAAESDTAVYMLGRNTGGEECDRRLENDYYLLDSEKALLKQICTAFPKVILLLNTNGVVDLSWLEDYPAIQAVLFIGMPGEMGMYAVSDLLRGAETPSGKLAFTIAQRYEDYPTADTFSFNKDDPDSIREYKHYGLDAIANGSIGHTKSPVTLYQEGIYLGYRYFDSFRKDVCYPFGYGLSYADFAVTPGKVSKEWYGVLVTVNIKNISSQYQGKETAQVYLSKPQDVMEQPYQEFVGCAKTAILAPGNSADVSVQIPWRMFASYDETVSAWVLPAGRYLLRVGTSSRDTWVAAVLIVEQEILYEKAHRALGLQAANEGRIGFLRPAGIQKDDSAELAQTPIFSITTTDIPAVTPKAARRIQDTAPCGSTLEAVRSGKMPMDMFLSQMSMEELAVLGTGFGSGLPFAGMGAAAPLTISYEDGTDIGANTHPSGMLGYVSPALKKYGIPSASYKDGPAGVGLLAWPTGMLMACSFNMEILYQFGAACGTEADLQKVDSWLAPALNLHRNPLGGRNFEYFSEDPVLTGLCGAAICRGVKEHCKTTACPKHFAVNEQETYRRGSKKLNYDAVDSILTERTARELYLLPFEMAVKSGGIRTLMTAFNKINGTFAAGSRDLCTTILRNEWGYDGVVVTDWGDMDIVVDGADAVAAGNDVIMPGGPPVIDQILRGYREMRVTREELLNAAGHLMNFVINTQAYAEWFENRKDILS